jgi:hypothetical protein
MSALSGLMTDEISVLKQDGSRIDNIKASVQTNKVFIDRSDVLIESGDLVQRIMSNGGEETFTVIDPGFHEKFHGIGAHYQMVVKKLGIPEAKKAIQTITYNITGANARINQNSTDNSINISTASPEVMEHLNAIRAEINRLVSDEVEKTSANEMVTAIEEQVNSGSPSKAVVSTLLKGLPAVGNISSLGSFIMSWFQ